MFFVEFYCLNRCITLRSITFTKDIFFHSLSLTLCEKYFLFWIWGDAFFGTPGNVSYFEMFIKLAIRQYFIVYLLIKFDRIYECFWIFMNMNTYLEIWIKKRNIPMIIEIGKSRNLFILCWWGHLDLFLTSCKLTSLAIIPIYELWKSFVG